MIQNDTLLDQLKQHPMADYSSPIARAAAAVIDLGLLTVIQLITAASVAGALGYHPTHNLIAGTDTTYLVFSPVVITALVLAYFPGLWAWRGRTPGMQLVGLRIRKATDLTSLDRRTALIRFAALLLAIAPAVLGLVIAFGDERRQALHDRLAGTVVVAE
jgi:uncharacterized RDD family membrane protein YckC